jgi:predicted RNase H-like HicB family nuclease
VTDRYMVVLEDAGRNISAYIPDLPGCVSTGGTIEETVTRIREAMAMHLAAMRRDGENVPRPSHHLGDRLEFADSAIGVVELSGAPAVAA